MAEQGGTEARIVGQEGELLCGTNALEGRLRGYQGRGRRRIEQREVRARAPTVQKQRGLGEVCRQDLRGGMRRKVLVIILRVAANDGARSLTAGTTSALIGTRLRGRHRHQSGHTTLRIAPGNAGEPGIYHHAHARHGQRGLRDRGSHDNAPLIGIQGGVLLRGGLLAVQRENIVAFQRIAHQVDLAHAGHKDQR